MECGFKENRVAVIALRKCGKSDSQIFKTLEAIENFAKFRLSGK
jgi:hypothetical protein